MVLGPVLGIETEFYGFVVAALYFPARLAYRGSLMRSVGNIGQIMANMIRKDKQPIETDLMLEIRFAPALLVAALASLGPRLVF